MKEEKCMGNIFRAQVSHFLSKSGYIVHKTQLIPLKRLSCKGCSNCLWLVDTLSEVNLDFPIINISEAKDKKMYRMGICNESKDWETGIVDDYNLQILEI